MPRRIVPEGQLFHYLLAVGVVAVACLLRWALPGVLAEMPFLVFFPAVVASAAYFGMGPGLFATLLSALAVQLLFTEYRDASDGGIHAIRLLLFSVTGIGISVVAGMRRGTLAAERRQTEALRDSESFYRQTLESIPGMVFTTRPDGYCDYQSRQWVEYTGVPMSEHMGSGWNELLHPDDRPGAYAAWRDAVEGRAPYEVEYRVRRHDGQYEWFKVVGRPIHDNAGKIVRWFGIATNIEANKRADEALRRSEARWNAAIESFAEGAIIATEDEQVIYWNPAARAMHGFDRPDEFIEPLEKTPVTFQLWTLDGRHQLELDEWPMRRIKRGETVRNLELLIRRPDQGWEKFFSYSGTMVDTTGGERLIFLSCRDLTELRRAERELRESEERLRLAAEGVDMGVWDLDLRTHVATRTLRHDQIFGYSEQQPLWTLEIGMRHVLPEDRPAITEAYAIAQETGKLFHESRVRWPDGSIHWISAHGRMYLDDTGKPLRIAGVVFDVTERRQAVEALQQSESQFRHLAEAMPQLVWTATPDGSYDYFNQRWFEYTGTSLEDSQGDLWSRLLHPDDLQRSLDRWQHSLRTGEPYEIEYRFRRALDGVYRWFLGRAVPVRDAAGNIARWFGTCTDIHEQKQAQEQLAAATARAERAQAEAERARHAVEDASRAKDHFLAVLSHELRNPLSPVVAAVSMLRHKPELDAETRQTMEMVYRNVELEARLIDDLLDVTRIERGKVELLKVPVELCTVIAHAVEVCKPDIDARGLHFALDWGPRPHWVDADVARLQQVFWNLLKNAVKFTPHGGCIGLRCRRADGRVVVEVTDSGIGIEPDAMPRLFNAFEQADRTITRQFGGLGLGLTISKAMVELHGGTIEAHSPGRDQGATFRVHLPLGVPGGPAHPAPVVRDTGAEPTEPVTRPLRILMVEDHADTARVMQRLLQLDGHEVTLAGDLATARTRTQEQTFDLILSDLGLPDGSGLDLVRELLQQGLGIPAIALSGYGQEHDIQRSRDAGFTRHLTKPANPDQLRRAIADVTGPGLGRD